MSDRCQTSHIAARLCSMRGMVVEDFCSVGRLVSVTTNGVVSESYAYDANGNRVGGEYDAGCYRVRHGYHSKLPQ